MFLSDLDTLDSSAVFFMVEVGNLTHMLRKRKSMQARHIWLLRLDFQDLALFAVSLVPRM